MHTKKLRSSRHMFSQTLMGKLFMEIHRADVGLLSTSSNSSDLFSPYSPSGLFKFGSVTDLKKSKSELQVVLILLKN